MHSEVGLQQHGREGDEQRIMLGRVPWSVYKSLVDARGEQSVPRITYRRGTIELMSPSEEHDRIALCIERLLSAFAEENGLELDGTGSWTIRNKERKLGAEADQSYVLGDRRPKVPDLAIEVVWTHGGLDKLEVYAGLEVPEVWFWREGQLEIYVLGATGYGKRRRSRLLPKLDIALLARFVRASGQVRAVREYRAALRRARR